MADDMNPSTPIPQDASVGSSGGAAIPQGATIGAAPSTPAGGAAIPQGAVIGNQAAPPSASAAPPPPQGILGQIGDAYSNYEKGIAKGVLGTTSGLGDIIHKAGEYIHPGLGEAIIPESGLRAEQNLAQTHGTAQGIGAGAESIAEFLLGDEALKGVSMADKYAHVSKVMKMAEKSPVLKRALQIGTDALRTGAVQGAQTTVKTGGDIQHGAADALGTAALTGGMGAAIGGASHFLGKGKQAADTIREMTQAAEHAPSPAAVDGQLGDTVNNAFSKEKGALQNSLDDATSTVGMFGEGAPQQQAITQAAKQYATTGRQAVKSAYQNGLDKLVEIAGDNTIPFENSPLHNAAKELSKAGEANAGILDEALNVGRPGSAKANRVIDNLANFNKPEGKPAAERFQAQFDNLFGGESHVGAAGEEPQPPSMNMNHLVDYRQKISELMRNVDGSTPEGRADKGVYQKLLAGTDDTIGQLADTIGKPEVPVGEEAPSEGRKLFDNMNESYRQGIQPFQNRDVRNVLTGNLNDVAKSIMGGQTSINDIAAVKQAVGPKNFQQVAKSSLQNIVQKFADPDTGDVDYKKLFQNFNRINPDVRAAMFGDQGKGLSDALKVATNSSNGLRDVDKQIQDLLGSGKIDSVLQNPQQAKAIAGVVGPDGMKALGQSVMQSEISKASTALDPKTGQIVASHFDPDKVLSWWTSMKDSPEVRDAFFSVDKDSAAHYNDTMSRLAQASSVKKLVKYGVLPLTLGTAGVVHGPGAALIGALAGLGTEAGFGQARDILNTIANNPKTWSILSGAGKAAEALDKSPMAKTARDVIAAKTTQAMTEDDQPK